MVKQDVTFCDFNIFLVVPNKIVNPTHLLSASADHHLYCYIMAYSIAIEYASSAFLEGININVTMTSLRLLSNYDQY